ncbi:MAG: hypothetical protein IPI68_05020 [Chitinophagaceae bacterium]|nr:hypothetical protein [Chitinophagaceae bacterium]
MGRLKTKQLVIFSGLTLLSFISCNKEDTITPTKTLEQLLTGKTWKADEIRAQLSNNTASYYKRGTVGTTYDSDSLKFAVNNTGTYYFSGSAYSITWNFSDAGKTKMTLVINQPPTPITIYIENMTISETFLKYAQYFTGPGVTYLASCTRVPN